MKLWTMISRVARKTEGAEIAEMAMVLPVMFLTFLGIFWMGRAYNIYTAVNQAAREGARAAVVPPCATCGGTYATDAAVAAVVAQNLKADSLDSSTTSVVATNPALTGVSCANGTTITCPTTNNIAICRNVSLTPIGVAPKECGVKVGYGYKMLSTIPLLYAAPGLQNALQNLRINGQAQMRTEQ
jgi:Flp pilus assembly protein TadG